MVETRPKVLALYRGVLELLDEGADINAIKVSDITAKAGIGKGTAYDYFKSREEILASALFYLVDQEIETEKEQLERLAGFSERMQHVFDWLERRFREQKSFMLILNVATRSNGINASILGELQKRKDSSCGPMKVLGEICRGGMESGEIRKEIPVPAACITTLSAIMAFAVYLEGAAEMPGLDSLWMKEFLCKGLLNQLK